jgi:RNA polymerase sigma-70 factor (ECF subfamily)
LASQTFLKLWEVIVTGGQIKALQALLYRIARNLVVDYYRSRQSTELPLEYDQDEPAYDPQQRLHARIDQHLLRQSISKLKEEYREVVVLRYVEDLSITEIAKILDKSVGNIRIICHRAIAELKNITKDYK